MLCLYVLLVVMTVTTSSCENKTCGENEELYSCGSACEPTCNDTPGPCTLQCLVDVCQCKSGYKRGPNGCQLPGPGCE